MGRNRAFSLVEVVMAIGITSFALLGMVALLPIGLKSSHAAVDLMTEAQIVQYARNQLELTSFTNLPIWSTNTLYFDNQGLPTTNGDPEQIYTTTFAVTNVALVTNGGTVSAPILINTGPNSTSTNAMLVQVFIVNRTVAGTSGTNIFPIVVPNAGF